jgi:hypothetical protein
MMNTTTILSYLYVYQEQKNTMLVNPVFNESWRKSSKMIRGSDPEESHENGDGGGIGYTISICTEPQDLSTPKSWRKRVRRMIRQEMENKWALQPLFENVQKNTETDDTSASSRVLLERWEELKDARHDFLVHIIKDRTADLAGTPLEYHSGDLQIDVVKKEIKLVWVTAQAQNAKRENQKSSARLLQKILRMKRSRNRPPEWDRYLELRSQWPAKAQSVMPLPDPDTVVKNRAMYDTQLQMLSAMGGRNISGGGETPVTSSHRQSSGSPLTTVMSEYLSMCLSKKETTTT